MRLIYSQAPLSFAVCSVSHTPKQGLGVGCEDTTATTRGQKSHSFRYEPSITGQPLGSTSRIMWEFHQDSASASTALTRFRSANPCFSCFYFEVYTESTWLTADSTHPYLSCMGAYKNIWPFQLSIMGDALSYQVEDSPDTTNAAQGDQKQPLHLLQCNRKNTLVEVNRPALYTLWSVFHYA